MNKSKLVNYIKTPKSSVEICSKIFEATYDSHIKNIRGWLAKDEACLLHTLSNYVEVECAIVEIGSYEGKSTIALASGARDGVELYAVDPHKGDITEIEAGLTVNTYESFVYNLNSAQLGHKVNLQRMTSAEAAKVYSGKPIGLFFVDGWHTTEAVIQDIDAWSKFLHPDAIVIFDDWNDAQVSAGINARLSQLPALMGAVGKELVFTNSSKLQRSELARYSKSVYRRLLILIWLSNLKSKLNPIKKVSKKPV